MSRPVGHTDNQITFAGSDGNIYSIRKLTLVKIRNYYYVKAGRKLQLVNRLVAQAFHDNPDSKPCVRYINGDTFDNRPENLAWATRQEVSRDWERSKGDLIVEAGTAQVVGPLRMKQIQP